MLQGMDMNFDIFDEIDGSAESARAHEQHHVVGNEPPRHTEGDHQRKAQHLFMSKGAAGS